MKLNDLLLKCTAAAEAGNPVVANWPQVRSAFALLSKIDALAETPVDAFFHRYPERFADLSAEQQHLAVSAFAYEAARREVARIVDMHTGPKDPWHFISSYLWRTGKHNYARYVHSVRKHAEADELTPAMLTTEWATAVDEKFGPGSERVAFRAGLKKLNALLDDSKLVAIGVLPDEQIGPMPVYDGKGRRLIDLPPRLGALGAECARLKLVWNAGCHAGILDAASDPDPGELLEPETWKRLEAIGPDLHGVMPAAWRSYLNASGFVIEKHTGKKRPEPKLIPDYWTSVLTETPEERAALRALWREICESNNEDLLSMDPHELLRVQVWRSIWQCNGDVRVAKSLKGYEILSRKALLRASPETPDPLDVVNRAWVDLPRRVKPDLVCMRKAALRAMLLPTEATEDFVTKYAPSNLVCTSALEALRSLEDEIEAERSKKLQRPCSIKAAWAHLRSIARDRGFNTSRLGCVEKHAVSSGLKPKEMRTEWVADVSASLAHRDRAKFSAELRNIDGMREDAVLKGLLPTETLSDIEDYRRNGNVALPEAVQAEIQHYAQRHGFAHNTLRHLKTSMTKVYTAGLNEGLITLPCRLVDVATVASVTPVDERTKRVAAILLGRLPSVC